MEKNGKKEDICEGLENDKEEVLLDDNKRILKPVQKKDIGSFF